jgi:hypothetical protein
MSRQSLKKLRVKIVREFGLPIIDACECVDLVAWGHLTEAELLNRLEDERKR